jgi:hypothetical protein
MVGVRETLKKAIEEQGLDMAWLSRECGMNHAYIQQFLGRGKPKHLPERVRVKLAELTGLSEEQLGKPRRSGDEHIPSEEIAAGLDGSLEGASSFRPYRGRVAGASPEIDAKAGGGPGQVGQLGVLAIGNGETVTSHRVVDEWVLPKNYLRHELHAAPARILVLEVVGDSMATTLLPGDRIFIDSTHTKLTPDGLYVIDEGDGPMVKRIQTIRGSKPPKIKVISDNPNHEAYELRLADVQVIGRVCARITRT